MNIPIVNIHGFDGDGSEQNQQERINYVLQVGTLSSALEHAVPEQMFVTEDNPGEAISAVKALSKASAAGQKIYHITNTNQTSVLPNINHNDLVMTEIRNALNTDKEVITHTDAVSVPGWSGAGYIIYDPVTGDGAYKIGGGENGAFKAFLGFIAMVMVFAIAIVAVHLAFVASFWVGLLVGIFEVFNAWQYAQSIKDANSEEDFSVATVVSMMIGLMGFLPGFTTGIAELGAVKWFGIIFATLLATFMG